MSLVSPTLLPDTPGSPNSIPTASRAPAVRDNEHEPLRRLISAPNPETLISPSDSSESGASASASSSRPGLPIVTPLQVALSSTTTTGPTTADVEFFLLPTTSYLPPTQSASSDMPPPLIHPSTERHPNDLPMYSPRSSSPSSRSSPLSSRSSSPSFSRTSRKSSTSTSNLGGNRARRGPLLRPPRSGSIHADSPLLPHVHASPSGSSLRSGSGSGSSLSPISKRSLDGAENLEWSSTLGDADADEHPGVVDILDLGMDFHRDFPATELRQSLDASLSSHSAGSNTASVSSHHPIFGSYSMSPAFTTSPHHHHGNGNISSKIRPSPARSTSRSSISSLSTSSSTSRSGAKKHPIFPTGLANTLREREAMAQRERERAQEREDDEIERVRQERERERRKRELEADMDRMMEAVVISAKERSRDIVRPRVKVSRISGSGTAVNPGALGGGEVNLGGGGTLRASVSLPPSSSPASSSLAVKNKLSSVSVSKPKLKLMMRGAVPATLTPSPLRSVSSQSDTNAISSSVSSPLSPPPQTGGSSTSRSVSASTSFASLAQSSSSTSKSRSTLSSVSSRASLASTESMASLSGEQQGSAGARGGWYDSADTVKPHSVDPSRRTDAAAAPLDSVPPPVVLHSSSPSFSLQDSSSQSTSAHLSSSEQSGASTPTKTKRTTAGGRLARLLGRAASVSNTDANSSTTTNSSSASSNNNAAAANGSTLPKGRARALTAKARENPGGDLLDGGDEVERHVPAEQGSALSRARSFRSGVRRQASLSALLSPHVVTPTAPPAIPSHSLLSVPTIIPSSVASVKSVGSEEGGKPTAVKTKSTTKPDKSDKSKWFLSWRPNPSGHSGSSGSSGSSRRTLALQTSSVPAPEPRKLTVNSYHHRSAIEIHRDDASSTGVSSSEENDATPTSRTYFRGPAEAIIKRPARARSASLSLDRVSPALILTQSPSPSPSPSDSSPQTPRPAVGANDLFIDAVKVREVRFVRPRSDSTDSYGMAPPYWNEAVRSATTDRTHPKYNAAVQT